jgi:cytochrome c-type biogenesis protein
VYDLLNAVSQFFYNPLTSLVYGTRSDIALPTDRKYWHDHVLWKSLLQKRIPWSEVIFYLLGKIVVFMSLGLVVWMFGEGFPLELKEAFQGFRKLLGPVFVMFLLFFGLLIPMVLSTPYGAVLPSIFAFGTALPFLFVVFLISYFELTGWFLKRGKKIGYSIQQTAGIFLVMIGILDTFTYWS